MSHDPRSPSDAADFDDDSEYEAQGIGCYDCESGWKHSCCDDMCRGSNEAVDCESGGIACKNCNPHGESPW